MHLTTRPPAAQTRRQSLSGGVLSTARSAFVRNSPDRLEALVWKNWGTARDRSGQALPGLVRPSDPHFFKGVRYHHHSVALFSIFAGVHSQTSHNRRPCAPTACHGISHGRPVCVADFHDISREIQQTPVWGLHQMPCDVAGTPVASISRKNSRLFPE